MYEFAQAGFKGVTGFSQISQWDEMLIAFALTKFSCAVAQ